MEVRQQSQRKRMDTSHGSRSWFWLMAIGCVSALGCGVDAYEQRLENARRYFAHMERIELNLKPTQPELRPHELRVPLTFDWVPPPQLQEGATELGPDLRQPDYTDLVLPGLIGAWQAGVTVSDAAGLSQRRAFLYLLSNRDLYAAGRGSEAPQFLQNLMNELWEKLEIAEPDRRAPEENIYPRTKSYAAPRSYSVANLRPSLEIDGTPYTMDVYLHQTESGVQSAIIAVLPVGLDPQSPVNERLTIMLEQFKVGDGSFSAPAAGGPSGGGSVPAAKASADF